MPTSTRSSTPLPPLSLRDWLTSVSPLVTDRRATSCDLAKDLVSFGAYAGPGREPLREAGRIAEMARTDLGLAGAMIHHSQAAFMLDEAGAGQVVNGTLLWAMPGQGLRADPGTPWRLHGRLDVCCEPPHTQAIYVVVDHERGQVLTVDLGESLCADAVRLPQRPGSSRSEVEVAGARAVQRGPISPDSLTRAIIYGGLLEAAAWYGALTRLGDAVVAAQAQEGGVDDRHTTTHLAEIDAILSATWGAIRDAVGVWERGRSSLRTARHHTARARTLTRLAASSVVFGFVPLEDAAARMAGCSPDAREQLVGWMARSDFASDADVVADALRTDGPSW